MGSVHFYSEARGASYREAFGEARASAPFMAGVSGYELVAPGPLESPAECVERHLAPGATEREVGRAGCVDLGGGAFAFFGRAAWSRFRAVIRDHRPLEPEDLDLGVFPSEREAMAACEAYVAALPERAPTAHWLAVAARFERAPWLRPRALARCGMAFASKAIATEWLPTGLGRARQAGTEALVVDASLDRSPGGLEGAERAGARQ